MFPRNRLTNTATYLLLLGFLRSVLTFTSFEVNFKSPVTWTPNKSMEFKGPIPQLKEFTSCHWEKKIFTSTKTSPAWNYCTCSSLVKDTESLSCISIYSAGVPNTASKSSDYVLSLSNVSNITLDITIPVSLTYHRFWNHICFAYSSIKNSTVLYYTVPTISI